MDRGGAGGVTVQVNQVQRRRGIVDASHVVPVRVVIADVEVTLRRRVLQTSTTRTMLPRQDLHEIICFGNFVLGEDRLVPLRTFRLNPRFGVKGSAETRSVRSSTGVVVRTVECAKPCRSACDQLGSAFAPAQPHRARRTSEKRAVGRGPPEPSSNSRTAPGPRWWCRTVCASPEARWARLGIALVRDRDHAWAPAASGRRPRARRSRRIHRGARNREPSVRDQGRVQDGGRRRRSPCVHLITRDPASLEPVTAQLR